MASYPSLPSVLPSEPGIPGSQEDGELAKGTLLGRATNPTETPIFICAFSSCHRLFPSRDKLVTHRKRDHNTDDGENHIITWND